MNERQEKRCKVYAVSIAEIPAQTDMKVLMDRIDPEHLTRIRRFRRQEDFLRSLYGEVLVRHVLRGMGYPDIRIQRTAKNKPFCPDIPQWKFSISHGGAWVAVSVSPFETGVDLEEIKGDCRDVYETVLTKGELDLLRRTAEPLQTKEFLRMWTVKEAWLKRTGEGLYRDPKEIDTTALGKAAESLQKGIENPVRVETLEFEPGYVLSVCGQAPVDPVVRRVKLTEIVEDWKEEGSRHGITDTFYPI